MTDKKSSDKRTLRSSSRPSLLKHIDLNELSAQFGISLSSGSESSDREFTPPADPTTSDSSVNTSDSSQVESESENDSEIEGEDEAEVDPAINDTVNFSIIKEEPELIDLVIKGEDNEEIHEICCVCLETSFDHDIVTCDKCGLSVHEGCYGVPEDDGVDETRSDLSSFSTIPWFCDSCRAGISNPSCELCPVEGGIYKQCVNGSWVHVICGLYCVGVEYVEPELLSGMTLDQIPSNRWGAKACQLCDNDWLSRTGVCIQCDAGLCKTFFHATCAQREGLLCEADDTSNHGDEGKAKRECKESEGELVDPYFAHCSVHCDKKLTKKKRATYLKMMKAVQAFHIKDDKRLERYLSDAQMEYKEVFKKMKRWYHPEEISVKGTRLLHHHPGAFKLLTKKAQLLGYTPQQLPQVPRQHFGVVSIGLTLDFVNYFNERGGKIDDLKLENDKQSMIQKSLKEKRQVLLGNKQKVEADLQLLKSSWQTTMETASKLCVMTNKLTKEEVLDINLMVPTHNTLHSPINHKDDHTRYKCCICECYHDNHLMVQCDTCSNRYHITCLDPPLTRVPKKTSKCGWQCEECCFDSEDELKPSVAKDNEPKSRFGRKLNHPRLTSWGLSSDFIIRSGRKRKRKSNNK